MSFPPRSDRGRQVLLIVTALVFAAIAVRSLLAPEAAAAELGYALANVEARSEFRAIYVGLWAAHVVLLVVAALRVRDALLGDLCAVLVLGQVAGRLLSVALDASLPGKLVPIFALEAAGGIALLLVRPSRTGKGANGGRGEHG